MPRAICIVTIASALALALSGAACSNSESRDGDAGVFRRAKKTKRLRQAKFEPEDFTFVEMQMQNGERDGLFTTCIHVPMFDQNQRSFDCDIGITLPIHVWNEKWPRIKEEAAKYVARAFNAMRKNMKSFDNADGRTCRAYYQQIEAYLKNGDKRQRETWKGADTMRCPDYQGTPLPAFYFGGDRLLIGDYAEWGKYVPSL